MKTPSVSMTRTTAYTVGKKTYRGGTVFPKTYHKIKSRQTFIVTMDCVDESDEEVFIMTLSLVMYRIENGFQSKLSNFKALRKVFKACCFVE